MRIAVNTRFLLPDKLEGFGWYAYETLRRIVQQHPEHQFIFFFDRPYDKKFLFADNIEPVVLFPPARHPFLYYWWFEFSVKKALKKYKADIFLSPDGFLSLRSGIPSLAVMHDLNFEHFPGDMRPVLRNYYQKFFPRFASKATRIVTISSYSRQDIIDRYHVNPDKIEVVYNGTNPAMRQFGETVNQETRLRFTGGKPYFIFVGALHPRKNLSRLFSAYDKFRKDNSSDIQLLIVGEKYFWNKEITLSFEKMKYKDEVIFTGHVQLDSLTKLYSAAHALTFLSYFEGFGLPLVEAMQSEIPVLTTEESCLPEIAGDAALYCKAFDIDDIAEKMKIISDDQLLRNRLITNGKKRATEFSWDKTAEGLWHALMKIKHA